jgi:hypothetical protein
LINIILDFLPISMIDFANTIEILKVFHLLVNPGQLSIPKHLKIKKMQWPEKNNLKSGKTEND